MEPRDHTQTDVNDSATSGSTRTRQAQSRSGPVLYELVDKDGRTYVAGSADGMMQRRFTFASAAEAAHFAGYLWPDQEQDPDRTGRGWNVQVVWAE